MIRVPGIECIVDLKLLAPTSTYVRIYGSSTACRVYNMRSRPQSHSPRSQGRIILYDDIVVVSRLKNNETTKITAPASKSLRKLSALPAVSSPAGKL